MFKPQFIVLYLLQLVVVIFFYIILCYLYLVCTHLLEFIYFFVTIFFNTFTYKLYILPKNWPWHDQFWSGFWLLIRIWIWISTSKIFLILTFVKVRGWRRRFQLCQSRNPPLPFTEREFSSYIKQYTILINLEF